LHRSLIARQLLLGAHRYHLTSSRNWLADDLQAYGLPSQVRRE